MNYKGKYISSAFLLLLSTVAVKVIGAVYKIPLTAYIGAVGRGYFASAYNVYLPVHAVIMGAFPIALSKLVGKYNALGDSRALAAVKKGADSLFIKVGIIGMLVIVVLAKPYSIVVASSPKCIYTILVLAPSVLFSALSASHRGYYEGYMNMKPTAISQTLEAVFKMVFGLIFAKFTMVYLTEAYGATGMVLGTAARNEKEALSLIYPVTSAAAMLGVTLGSAVSYIYVVIYHRINRGGLPRPGRGESSKMKGVLLKLSFPIMMSTAVQSVFQFLDTATVQYALGTVDASVFKSVYGECLSLSSTHGGDIVTYVYGLFSTASDFKNLVPGITMALGICAVPAVSGAFELRDREHLSAMINEVYKYTVLLSVLGGVFLALSSRDILDFFYKNSSPDIPIGCEMTVRYFGFTVPFYCLAGAAVFCVQAIGRADKSVTPYIVSGIIRSFLNIILVRQENFLLSGAVISGAAGYLLIAFCNILIVKKYSKASFSFKNVLIKPTVVGCVLYFSLQYVYNFIEFSSNIAVNLLIKSAICALAFCMLCFLFKTLNFKEIFCIINNKKYPRNTCN